MTTYDELRSDYSDHFKFDVIFDQNHYTQARLRDLTSNLVLGALVVVGIVLLTMGWRAALVVGSVLPLACAGTLFTFSFLGQSIHQMSIFGMIIAIGLMIDSAIVMTDEIRKSIHDKGMQPIAAMQHSVHHLFTPLMASTFTTILGFMPIFLLPGSAGDFVGPIAISVVMALIFSFFLAITVIPALAAITNKPLKPSQSNWFTQGLSKPKVADDFKQLTVKALRTPKRYIILTILPCLIGFWSMSTMKVEFFPAADRDMFEVQIYLPSNSAIDYTKRQVMVADDILNNIDGIVETHWTMGSSTPSVYYNQIPLQDNNSAFAQAVVTTINSETADTLLSVVQARLNEALPEARAIVKKFSQGPPADAPVAFRLLGPEVSKLREIGEQIRAIMHQHTDIIHSRASIEGGQAKLWVEPNEISAELAGLDLVSVANQLQGNLEGFIGGSVLEGVQLLPIRVRLDDAERENIAYAGNIPLSSPTDDRIIPIEAIGKITLNPQVTQITRYNGERVNTNLAYLKGDAKPVSVTNDLLETINNSIKLPAGYSIEIAGESEQQADAVSGLAIYAPVLVTMMIATIILAFRSVAMAAIVFSVALLAVGLGMLSLKISGYPLGFNPLIGLIGLLGIVINDTIVILAAIRGNEKARQGDSFEIVRETYGCGRHVLSTTFTTIGGFVPLLLFSGGSFWPPLTVVIAGGIGFSLILAMFFTPLAYQIYANTISQTINLPHSNRRPMSQYFA